MSTHLSYNASDIDPMATLGFADDPATEAMLDRFRTELEAEINRRLEAAGDDREVTITDGQQDYVAPDPEFSEILDDAFRAVWDLFESTNPDVDHRS